MTALRSYRRTHKWISFRLDLTEQPDPELWMLLGEARSKCEHIANTPLTPETAESLHKVYLAKGALATTAIEGNTLSEREVSQHLEGKLDLPPSREYLKTEVDNIVRVYNWICQEIAGSGPPPLTVKMIKRFNREVLANLDHEDEIVPGEIRKHVVGVARYRGAPPQDCEYLMGHLCDWLNGPDFHSEKPEMEIVYGVIRAVVAHLYIAWIHPFADGNGRTARLIEFLALVSAGAPVPAAHVMADHYNRTRTQYYLELDRASRSGGNVRPFLYYAIRGLVDGLCEQLDLVRSQQWRLTWEYHVHETFRHEKGYANARRQNLAIALARSDRAKPVPLQEIRQLTSQISKAYLQRTDRTVLRDLKFLSAKNLVAQVRGGWLANRALILALLPQRHYPNSPRPPTEE